MANVNEIINYLRAGTGITFVRTYEEQRFIEDLDTVINDDDSLSLELFVWSVASGLTNMEAGTANSGVSDPASILSHIAGYDTPEEKSGSIFVLKDFNSFMMNAIPRQTKDLIQSEEMGTKRIIILAPELDVGNISYPTILEKETAVIDFDLPDEECLRNTINGFIDDLNEDAEEDIEYTDKEKETLVYAAKGLTVTELAAALNLSYVKNGRFQYETIIDTKKDIVKKRGVLEYIDVEEDMSSVGGLNIAKKYINMYSRSFDHEAKSFGVEPPRGIILLGVPGTGKSLLAKVCSSEWKMPCLRLDIGSIMSSLVGSSENNMRNALGLAEATAPCVVGSTVIELSDGSYATAEELFTRTHKYRDVVCRAFDTETYECTDSVLTGISKKPVGEHGLFKIKTQGGEIVVTGNHKLFTKRGWVTARDVNIKDKILFPKAKKETKKSDLSPDIRLPYSIRAYTGTTKWNRPVFEYVEGYTFKHPILSKYTKFALGSGGFTDSIIYKMPTLSESSRIGRLIGLIDSEGWWDDRKENYKFCFVNSDPDLLDEFEGLVKDLFGIYCIRRINKQAGTKTEKKSGEIITTKKDSFVCTCANKLALKILLFFRENIFKKELHDGLIGWLCGMLDGGGHIDTKRNKITFTQKKQPQQNMILSALRRLNIFVGVGKSGKTIEITGYSRVRKLSSMLGYTHYFSKVCWSAPRGVEEHEWGTFISVKEVSDVTGQEEFVYDLHLEDPHTYISNGMLSHNCVLWIDELEKATSGVKSSNRTDSGTTARVFGTLLTWVQEHKSDVVCLATANDISSIPPELIRRFNEVFFVDLPNLEERKEIFKIHLKKRGIKYQTKSNKKGVNIHKAGLLAEDYTGAEIEKAVKYGIAKAYFGGDKKVGTNHIEAGIKDTNPIVRVHKEEIEKIRDWAKGRATYASGIDEDKKDGSKRKSKII